MNADKTLFPVSLLITVVALVAVLVLAWLALKGLSRFTVPQGSTGRVKVVQSISVGSRERLVVVQFGDQEYLVGISAGGITNLANQPTSQKDGTDEDTRSVTVNQR